MRNSLMLFFLLWLSAIIHAQTMEKPDLTWLLQIDKAQSLRYWFDADTNVSETAVTNSHFDIDASSLLDGLHTIHFQIVDTKGNVGNISSSIFFKTPEDKEAETIKIRKIIYWFDNDANLNELDASGGGQMVDVSNLEEGVHTIHCQAICSNGEIAPVVSSVFVYANVVDIENRITKYIYWLNDNTTEKKTVELENASNPYRLVDLLPVKQEPIRSSSFHLEIVDGQPVIYAVNDFHIRFQDVRGYFVDESQPYTDYRIRKTVDINEWLIPGEGKTINKPSENDIKWYRFNAEAGDSLQFRLDRSATIQVFSPSGKEIHSVSGAESIKWSGLHVWEEGTFYLALHDVTAKQGSTITLNYNHIDKYAVLRQDVTVVGNGGCSTITVDGNGFRDLFSVDLFTAQGDSIHHVDIGHESDAQTSLTFDFSDAALGEYDAVFHFTTEDKVFHKFVTVEEARDIELATTVTYPSTFLRGTSTTYTVKIKNSGNMTAYDIPVYVYVSRPSIGSISKIELEGRSVKDLSTSIYANILNAEALAVLDSIADRQGLLAYLITGKDVSDDSNDSVYVSNGYIWQDVEPNSTATFSLTLYSAEKVSVWFTVPNYLSAQHVASSQSKPMFAKRMTQTTTREWDEDCLHVKEDCYFSKRRNLEYLPDPVGSTMAIRRKTVRRNNEDCHWTYKRIPGCPPIPPGGGASGPVNSIDPNDIYGYLSEAGSKFIADSVARVNYTIEFENDTTFAMASAHTIVIRDTLDSRYFNMNAFLPTGIKLGGHDVFMEDADVTTKDGRTTFIKTIDVRPAINAIAQVEGAFDSHTGIAEWRFTSLDPMTMEPTDDLMQGILPVNYDGTSGIGEVMFEIGMKQGKPNGTEIDNRASIVFDYEEAILTPTWTNIVDGTAPESRAVGVELASDTTAVVSIQANDELSGVWRYDVYVQYGAGSTWWKVAENVPADTTATVKIYDGIDHGFYVVATDSAGNVERKQAMRELTLNLSSTIRGDVNRDGQIGIADIVAVTGYMAGTNSNVSLASADVNGDGQVGIADIVAITDIMAGTASMRSRQNARYKTYFVKQKKYVQQ